MRKNHLFLMLPVLMALGLASCNNNQFRIEGNITNAEDSVLYFENVGIEGISTLDSVRLSPDGAFTFRADAPEAPEFYRLRISDQIINISIDSTEAVGVKAEYPQMATDYEVSGSDNCQKIKELALKQIALQERIISLERSSMERTQRLDSLQSMLRAYKEDVKLNYIFPAPYKPYAYFALFQAIGPWLIFDSKGDRDDIKVFAAVATSWDTYYPGALRGENLHNIAIEGMKNVRIADANNQQVISEDKVIEAGIIDIELPDNHGTKRRLSDLKGKVVMLDFHAFGLKDSPARILSLRELYNKYHDLGFEIFQVSVDSDEHFWKQTTKALPWISVRDNDGVGSERIMLYNVQSVPEFFLIDRNNNLVKRSGQMKDIDSEIKALL
ncbi:MAG: AhpC/TSA family protein [Prevotella sp.]|nr:AhpC/TSA family protein [Prevotella sp.]